MRGKGYAIEEISQWITSGVFGSEAVPVTKRACPIVMAYLNSSGWVVAD